MQQNNSVYNATMVSFPQNHLESGNLTAINSNVEIPFSISRVYYLYDVPNGAERGGHGHRELHQVIFALTGSFEVKLNDGSVNRTFFLNRPNEGLYLPPGLWRDLSNFSSGAICLVLASLEYDESDYIRNYEDFKQYRGIR